MGQFTADLSKFCHQEGPQYLDAVTRKSVIEITNRLIMRSPVGDPDLWEHYTPGDGYVGGRFRANWQYGFNYDPAGVIDAVDPSGSSALNAVVSGAMRNPGDGMTYIVNNLPYAQRLEDGYSSQAPRGMVRLVEIEFPDIVRMASA